MTVAYPGIQCLCVELGDFGTPVLNADAENAKVTSTSYTEVVEAALEIRASSDDKQPGDLKKAVELVIDLMKDEGCAAGRTVPLRLPTGPDAPRGIMANCEIMLMTMERRY